MDKIRIKETIQIKMVGKKRIHMSIRTRERMGKGRVKGKVKIRGKVRDKIKIKGKVKTITKAIRGRVGEAKVMQQQ